jgi:galactose oxidase
VQVFVLGGSWSGGTGGKIGEVFDGTAWRKLANVKTGPMQTADFRGIYRQDNHGCVAGPVAV